MGQRLRPGTAYWSALTGLLASAAMAASAEIPPAKAVITLTPKFGPVTFAHQRHSELDGVTCATCHHTMEASGEGIQSCYLCHEARLFRIAEIRKANREPVEGNAPQVPNAQEAFHGLCTGCHHHRLDQGLAAGPDDSCRDCHQ